MKRLHVNIKVEDLQKSVSFYSALFASPPTVKKEDYAKWMLDDPLVNFSISDAKGMPAGIEHLGIQAESEAELQDLYSRVDSAEGKLRNEGDTVCCYAKSTKGWIKDPQKVEWEMFYTYGESDTFYAEGEESNCCQPASNSVGEAESVSAGNSCC
ncbi:MAG: ArsI/CadI family heavy metal resistance metalloenzyme [Bacteroidota bacterium]